MRAAAHEGHTMDEKLHQEATPQSDVPLRTAIESPSQWGRILTIEFARQHYDQEYERMMHDLRKRVVRPGFRKGKVPRHLIEHDFGDKVRQDVLQALLPDVFNRAFEQENLDVIASNLRTVDLDNPESVRLELEVDVRPRIELAPLDTLSVERWTGSPSESELDAALQQLRDQNASFVAVERAAAEGDFVNVSYVPIDDDGKEVSTQKVEDYPFQLGAGQVVAEIEAAVRGLTMGQTARANVRYESRDATAASASGSVKTVSLLLTVKEVKEKRLPELDDELARDLELENLEALRHQVRENLSRQLEEQSQQVLDARLVDALIAANPFEPPSSTVETYLDAMRQDFAARSYRANRDPDEAERQTFEQVARPEAERAARRTVLFDAIRSKHDIDVSEEDIDKWIEDRVEAGGPESGKIRAFFSEPRHRRRLRSEMLDRKVFELLRGQATIRDVPRPTAHDKPAVQVAGQGD